MTTTVQGTPKRFLFVMWEGGGNVPPQLGIAQRLVQRGHSVRVMSDPCNEAEVRAVGCDFVPYVRAPHRYDKTRETTIISDYEAKNPMDAFLLLQKRLMFGPALAFAEDVLAELNRQPADAVAINDVLFGAMIAAEKANVPSIILMPNCYLGPARGFPLAGMPPLQGPLGRLRDAIVGKIFSGMFAKGLPALNDARIQLGLPPVKHPYDQMAQAERVLVLTSQDFDFKAEWLPANVRYVGPQLNDPVWTQTWDSPWPQEHPDPLVVVSFSTTFQNQPEILQRVIDALGGLQVRGMVTLGPTLNARQFRIPNNVIVRASAPHTQIFPEAATVVTHAGHGTVIRALASGVPLVCIPMGRDQNDNATRVVVRGAGLRLKPGDEVSKIRDTIQRVLENPEFRVNARHLASAIQRDAQASTAVEEMEKVADKRVPAYALSH